MSWAAGQALKPLEKAPFTREQLRDYAAAALDHNPIHLDDGEAQKSGFPTVIVHGMLSMACLADHVAYNFPPAHFRVERFKARFRKVTFPGDALTCQGEVRRILPEGGLLVTVRAENQRGEITAEGEAEVRPI